jgi:hypothetical protein
VQTAQRLQGRLSAGEIAELVGVRERTVRAYWRAGMCARCGGVQIRAASSSCADCIPYVALERPAKREVMRALRRWARETGAAPKVSDWREPAENGSVSTRPGRRRGTCSRTSTAGRRR